MRTTLHWILFSSVLPGLPVLTGAQDISHQRIVIDETPPQNPWIKIAGDLNGDGDPDIIIGGSKGPLIWYRNPDWST